MRRFAPLLLLLFIVAFLEPVTSAALSRPAGASCCRRAGSAMCCHLDGSCVMTTCRGSEGEARSAGLAPFTVPCTFELSVPRGTLWSRATLGERPEPGASTLPDPPPRA